jgi:hypothetical protein
MNKTSWFVLLGVCLFSSRSHALDLTVVGSGELSYLTSDVITNSALTETVGVGFGGGMLVSQALSPLFSLEAGLLLLPRHISSTSTLPGQSNTVTGKFSYYEIPLLVRYNPPDSLFSFGVGAYYAHGLGNIRNPDTQTAYASFEDENLSRSDYGLLGAIGIRVPIASQIAFYGDLRSALGVKNINTTSSDTNSWRDYVQLLLGASFTL